MVISGVAVVVIASLWWHHRSSRSLPSGKPVAQERADHAIAQGGHDAVNPDAKPAHVEVRVTDEKGSVAHATVRLVNDDGEVVLADTDAGGLARADVPAGGWTISASHADDMPAAAKHRELHEDETARLEIALARGGVTLTGVVTDATGGPVGGARIDASALDGLARPGDAIASTLTSSDGKYTMTVAPGHLLVAASDADYAPQARHVEVGTTGAKADFQLVPGGVIEGIVRDETTREPVAAIVIAERDEGAARFGEVGRHHAAAKADGKFRLTGLRPGSYELAATAGKRVSHAPTVVGLGVAEQIADVEILVGASATVRGVVVDDTGAPATGVTVSAFDDSATAESDAKGGFELSGLSPGKHMLIGRGGDFIPGGMTPVDVGTKDLDGVRVTVKRGLAIKGHVEPRQVCDVRLDIDDRALGPDLPMLVSPVTTAADGAFELKPVSAVGYTIVARCASGDQGSQAVTVAPGAPEQIVHVTPGASIAGRVVDTAGKTVAGVVVMAAQQAGSEHMMIVNGVVTSGVQAMTDAAGKFEVRGLQPGTYRLRVLDRGKPLPMRSPESATKVTVAAAAKKTGVELAVDRADGVIRGTVTDDAGKPIADAWVSVHQDLEAMVSGMAGSGAPDREGDSRMITIQNSDDGGGAGEAAPSLTDASGHFEITGLTRDSWDVVAEAQAGKLRGRAEHVKPDATITIQARGVTELRGVVHAPGGTPPSSFSVALEGPTRAERSFATPDGSFSFARVDPGTYKVRVTSTAGNGEAPATVTAGATATVDVTLASNAVVVGKLVDSAGKPLGGVPVTVVPDTGERGVRVQLEGPPPTSSSDGKFRVETKAGKSTLVVMTPPRPTVKQGLMLEAGKTLDVGDVTVSGSPPKP
jgi:protocatechuate 3,4-dioxygenase beta subunit